MRLSLITVVPFAALVACSGGGSSSDAGTGADGGGAQSGACTENSVEFTGNVIYDPVELACRGLPPTWTSTGSCTNGSSSSIMGDFDGGMTLADAGTMVFAADGGTALVCNSETPNPPPCLNGDTFRVEDAIRALNNLPPLNTEPMMASGSFDVPAVNVENTTLALIGTVVDPSNTSDPMQGLAFSGYGLGKPCFYDSKAAGETENSLDLPVYVASSAFGQMIATAIGQDYSAMLAQGVVIAHVTSDLGGTQGVSGYQLVNVYGSGANENFPVVSNSASPTIYLSDDLTTGTDITTDAAAATGAQGVIIRLNAGSAAEYTVAAVGDTSPGFKYEHHLNGSRPGTILEVFFRKCLSTDQEGCH